VEDDEYSKDPQGSALEMEDLVRCLDDLGFPGDCERVATLAVELAGLPLKEGKLKFFFEDKGSPPVIKTLKKWATDNFKSVGAFVAKIFEKAEQKDRRSAMKLNLGKAKAKSSVKETKQTGRQTEAVVIEEKKSAARVKVLTIGSLAARLTALGYPHNAMQVALFGRQQWFWRADLRILAP
jgi:hypothetical protein